MIEWLLTAGLYEWAHLIAIALCMGVMMGIIQGGE
jgi:hypothetical protein